MIVSRKQKAEDINKRNVASAINNGIILLRLKEKLGYRHFGEYIISNVSYSRSMCNKYMLLAKTPILEKYYHLGIRNLCKMIHNKINLSV